MIPSKTTLVAALGALSLTGASGASGAEPAWKALFPDIPMTLADYDGDGLLDALVLAADGAPRLLHNLGATGFEDATDALGLNAVGAVQGASWHDVDSDGHVDLTLFTPEGGVRVFYNSADGIFAEGTEGSGLEQAQGVLAARWTDLDGDGLSELWTASSSGARLWRNVGDGFFVELPLPETGTGGYGTFGLGGLSSSAAPGDLPGLEPSSLPGPEVVGGFVDFFLDGTFCLPRIADLAGGCLQASSTPTMGQLFPLTASTVPGLSADKLDGIDSSSFSQLGQSIEGSEITAGAVGTSEIAVNAINSNHIQPGSVNSTDIQDGQVGASDLALFTIHNGHISGSAGISGSKIVAHFGAQDLTTDKRLGVGTVLPLEDLHVVGSPTMGTALITPDAANGQDSELILGEIDDGSFGMRMSYDGGTNTMSLGGVNAGVNSTHWQLTRDSGRMGIGTAPITDTRVYIDDDNRWGVRVKADSTYAGITYGVSADNSNEEGIGVYGIASNAGAFGSGVRGACLGPIGLAIFSEGTFAATGAKLFVQPHPQDAGREVRFACLEGNESGTYFRGSSRLFGGEAIIDVPEDFRLVTEADGMTVQVTAMGLPAALYVVSKDLDRIVVRGSADVDFDYFVNGIRRGYGAFETLAENRCYVPTERGVPFGTQYPDAVRQILVENGTLNPDFTPNEVTAAALGWVLRDPAPIGSVHEQAPID